MGTSVFDVIVKNLLTILFINSLHLQKKLKHMQTPARKNSGQDYISNKSTAHILQRAKIIFPIEAQLIFYKLS